MALLDPSSRDGMLADALEVLLGAVDVARPVRAGFPDGLDPAGFTASVWLPDGVVGRVPVGWLCATDPAAPVPAPSVARWLAARDLSGDAAAVLVGLVGRPDRLPFLDDRSDLSTVTAAAVALTSG